MFKNHIDIKLKHKKFIKEVCETEIVFALKSKNGFATSYSNEFEDEDGEPIGIICFWSKEIMAKICAKNEWDDYHPAAINLSDFLENWCIGMHNDGLLVGTNFDQHLFGYESEGYNLILEIITELKKTKKELDLKKFENIEDFENQTKKTIR
ncbi:hypothetical protein GCM10022422_10730 [Flavobacterium ginsengisoli]|uniref:DUF2750 domain-containing protein n=2 Tax=Flavobacterium ginsengisoli TaxID=871694 RepID=A0ABP7F3Q2_9FLAO|nr:DUF2750 domain-containing protein [Flavobacterium sp. UBA4854]